ncbi:MAG: D-sedoheptulose 7-phosphate isomerase [Candidatus Acidoferrales bacterium]
MATANKADSTGRARGEWVRERIRESARVKEELAAGSAAGVLVQVAGALVSAYRGGGKVLLFGNGGSAADAQHIAAELAGKYYFDRAPLEAWALHTNTSALTAIGNDYGYRHVFARQVEAAARPGDVVVGISTSGNSENVIEGIRAARQRGAVTVALTGASGGRLKELVDFCLAVPANDTPRIQEAHILLGHILCELVEQELFGPGRECGGREEAYAGVPSVGRGARSRSRQ